MLTAHQKSSGTSYTVQVAILAAALIFIPALLAISHPLGYVSVSIAVACISASIAWVGITWKSYAQLYIPSLEVQKRLVK